MLISFLLLCMLWSFSLKGEEDVSLLFRDLKVVEEVNQEIGDHLPYHYNAVLTGGYFNMPSARVAKEGTVALGFSYVPPYRNYAATLVPLPRLELSLNYRVFIGIPDPDMGELGFGSFSDRGINAKLSLFQPSDGFPYFPEVTVGCEDFYGTKRFHSFYFVATKTLLDWNLEATVGWGKGRMKGFFAGMGWTPFRKSAYSLLKGVSVLAEYDAIDYKHHLGEHPQGREVKCPINVGLSASFFDFLQLSFSSLRGKELLAFASLHYNLGESPGFFS